MSIVLDDIQLDAVHKLQTHNRYCLFWDVGVGKTFVVLEALRRFTNKKILILSPAVVAYGMWEEQVEKDLFGVFRNNDVEVRSYEWLAHCKYKMVNGRRKLEKENFRELRHKQYDIIICDEAHRMATSKRTSSSSKYVSRLAKSAEYVYALTGTPARNGYQDLFYLFKNLGFDIWTEFTSYDDWLRHFFVGYEIKIPTGSIFKPTMIKPYLEDSFFASLKDHCTFASKKRNYEVIHRPYPVKPIINKEYVDSLNGILTDITGTQVTVGKLVGVSKAYMILNGFEYKMNEEGVNETIEYFNNPKLEAIDTLVDHYHKYRNGLIIVYNYKQDYRKLSELLDKKGVIYVDNLEDAAELADKKVKFVYLLQLKKGIGVNLQHISSVMIFYTYNFSYVDFDQTIGRIDRRGQEEDVEIVYVYYPKTIETSLILKALNSKKSVDQILKNSQNDISKEIAEYGNSKVRNR